MRPRGGRAYGAAELLQDLEVALEVLPFASDRRLAALDLGVGTGFLTSRFLARYGGSTVLAVDGPPEMIPRAKSRLQRFSGQVPPFGRMP